MSQTLRRFALPLLAAALLVVGISAFSSAASAAEVCTNTHYFGWGTGQSVNYSVAYDAAFWNAVGGIEAAHPECEMASASVLEEIQALSCPDGGPYSSVACAIVVSLRVRYVCRVCTGW